MAGRRIPVEILPQTGEEMGLKVAERIRQAAASNDLKPETFQSIHMTVTIGVGIPFLAWTSPLAWPPSRPLTRRFMPARKMERTGLK